MVIVAEVDTENVAVVTINEVDTPTSNSALEDTGSRVEHHEDPMNPNNNFMVRMHVHPFNFYPSPKISPAYHTRLRLPASSASFIEKEEIQQEWNELFQHWNEILKREETVSREVLYDALSLGSLVLFAFFDLMLILVSHLDPYQFELYSKILIQGLPVPLWILFTKDAIRTTLRYGDKSKTNRNNDKSTTASTMNFENDIVDVNRHYPSTMMTTGNRVLVQVDRVSGVATIAVSFGFWTVATGLIYQMEQSDYWSVWSYFHLVTLPILLVSCYALYHIGGSMTLCLSYRSRYMDYLRRQADVLKRVHFEICRHNDELTCFTLQPKDNFDGAAIVVDIYYKSCAPNDRTFENSTNTVPSWKLLSSASNNLGVTKRRGGNDHGFIVLIDGDGSDEQLPQPQQQSLRMEHQLHYDDVHDGLITPLLTKDMSV